MPDLVRQAQPRDFAEPHAAEEAHLTREHKQGGDAQVGGFSVERLDQAAAQALARSQTQPYWDVQRARALVACADPPDWSDDQVAAHIGASPRMVRQWRKRWRDTHSLQDAPRSGRPRVFFP